MNNLQPQVLFLASVVLQDFIKNSWAMISNDGESLVSLLITIINENSTIVDQPHITKLILILCTIFFLNFELFSFVSEINQSLLPYVFSNLYEIFNTQEPFLMEIFSISQQNLQNQFSNSLELLDHFDPDSEWLELHYQLLYFNLRFSGNSNDFSNFIPFLEKIQVSTTTTQNSDNILKLFQLILSTYMDDSSTEDQIYFANIIEIAISLSNSIIESEDMSDDNYYEYVIFLWDAIFDIKGFFYECDHFDLLDEIVTEHLKSLPQLIRHSSVFTDSLYKFSDFLNSNSESETLIPLVTSFLDFLSALVNSEDDFFRDIEITNCFECIQKGFEECLSNYIVSIVEQNQDKLPESFYLILASTEPKFSANFSEFASNSLIQIMKENSPSISASTALFFIRKTGVYVKNEVIVSNLISIAMELFDKDSNGAAKCISDVSSSAPGILSHFSTQIMAISSSGKLKINESCTLVISLYMILPFLADQSESEGSCSSEEALEFIISFVLNYLKEIVPLFEDQKSTIALDNLNDCCYFIITLLENTPTSVPAEFKSSLFDTISSSLKPLFLIDDDKTQEDFCTLFNLFFQLEYVARSDQASIVAEWLEKIVPSHPKSCYFNLIEFIIGDFEFPSILQCCVSFVEKKIQCQNEAEFDSDENEIESKIVDCVIHKLFQKKKAVFWETFSEQFILSLLTRNSNLIALNNSLDLFEDIFDCTDPDSFQRITADFTVMSLHLLFESMIAFYLPRQIKSSLKIVHLIVKNNFLPCETVISVFLEFFDIKIEGIENLVDRFSSLKNDEEEDEDENRLDLEDEFNLIFAAINFIRQQKQ